MPIGFTSSCTDTVFTGSCTLDCTLVFVCSTHVWHMCVALARAHVCMQSMTRAHIEMKCTEKNGTFHDYCFYAFVCNQCFVYNLHIAIFSRVYSYVTRMYSCYSYVLVCSFSHDQRYEGLRQVHDIHIFTRSCTLNCTLIFVCGTRVWHLSALACECKA